MVEAPLIATWYATGNNVAVAADTARRVCHIRSGHPRQWVAPEERPEVRQGFCHPDLIGWVAQHRNRLLRPALTLLSGYCAAGRPDQGLRAWGSYEGWSRLVRGAVVWAGLPDPAETRILLQEKSDVTAGAGAMAALLAAWERLDPERRGPTAAEVIEWLKCPPSLAPDWYADLREAVETLVGRLDARASGTRLRSYRRRVFAGRFLDQAGQAHRAARWVVSPASQFRRGLSNGRGEVVGGTRIGSSGRPEGECDECGECVSLGAADADHRGDAWEGDDPPF